MFHWWHLLQIVLESSLGRSSGTNVKVDSFLRRHLGGVPATHGDEMSLGFGLRLADTGILFEEETEPLVHLSAHHGLRESGTVVSASRRYCFGKAKLRMRSPPRRPREPPPEATVTNSCPSTMYTAGEAKIPEPVL